VLEAHGGLTGFRHDTIREGDTTTYLINHLRIPGGIPKEENLAYLERGGHHGALRRNAPRAVTRRAFDFSSWWRRWELNPRPKTVLRGLLHAEACSVDETISVNNTVASERSTCMTISMTLASRCYFGGWFGLFRPSTAYFRSEFERLGLYPTGTKMTLGRGGVKRSLSE
jgi:hypothetical protein